MSESGHCKTVFVKRRSEIDTVVAFRLDRLNLRHETVSLYIAFKWLVICDKWGVGSWRKAISPLRHFEYAPDQIPARIQISNSVNGYKG
jgi:hypothetical protein